MHAAVVAIYELHEAVFADNLTRVPGVSWEARDRSRDLNPAWAIAAVPEALVKEFSTRARHIDAETDRLICQYVEERGRRPASPLRTATASGWRVTCLLQLVNPIALNFDIVE